MKFRLLLAAGLLLAGCAHQTAPVRLYFVASSRFLSGNRTGLQPADTLAARLFALADGEGGRSLQRVRVTVTYSPTRQPFAYPTLLSSFVYANVPPGETITYLDSTFASPGPRDFLLTNVFGVRTTTGSERWEYTATDNEKNTSTRSYITTVRRADSTLIYHDYVLRLNVPARGVGARRFIQLNSGLALPAYAVVGTSANPTPDQQPLTDLVQSADGLSLISPDTLSSVAVASLARWPSPNRSRTRFHLTALTPTTFESQTDTVSIRRQFTGRTLARLTSLTTGQVYAFRTYPLTGAPGVFGLLRVVSVPGGNTAGLQLQIRVAKR